MKFFRTVPLVACCFLFVVSLKCLAADDPIITARPAAKAWLAMIDGGQYAGSYATAGEGLHQAVDEKKWDLVLKAMRPAWGDLVSRSEEKHLYQPNGIQGLSGECMIISYETSFKRLPLAMEMVILRYEDGKWRGVGYTAGPKPTNQPTDPVPITESSTTYHAKPTDQKPPPSPAVQH